MTQHDARPARPVLLEVGAQTWEELRDRVPPWLATTALLQATFRHVADDATRLVTQPQIHGHLRDIAQTARRHEAVVARLYPAFGLSPRRPHRVRAAPALAAGRQLAGQLLGRAAGAHGPGWRTMRELLRSNLDAISGFAVAEQLGLALGAPPAVDLVFPVLQEKQKHQLLLQEYLLEMGANAVLYRRDP